MKPFLIVHGYSAESRSEDDEAIRNIYGELPQALRDKFGVEVQELDLSRYISLEDGITIDDISRAMNRTLEREFPQLLAGGCNVIVHSTGALVVRNWLRRYWDSTQKCPIERVIHLAGANFGSGFAHIGRTQLAKWVRLIFQRVERGVNVLKALELGSNWTIQMHSELDGKIRAAQRIHRPLEFCLIGSEWPDIFAPIPVKYANEDSTDGVVRVCSGNLNYTYLKIAPKPDVSQMPYDEIRALADKGIGVTATALKKPNLAPESETGSDYYHVEKSWESLPIPFAVIAECSHTHKETSIVDGELPRAQVLDLIETAVNTTEASLDQAVRDFSASYQTTLDRARLMNNRKFALIFDINRRKKYNQYAQVIFRIFDQDGAPVKSFNAFFNSFGGDGRPRQSINELFKDGHPNQISPNTITFYIQRKTWQLNANPENDSDGDWKDVIANIHGVDLEIDAVDHGNNLVKYMPLRYRLNQQMLMDWLKPNQTTIVDVHLYRMPADKVFKIVSDQ